MRGERRGNVASELGPLTGHAKIDAYVGISLILFAAYCITIYVQYVYLNENVLPYQLFIGNDVLETIPRYLSGTYSFGSHYFGDYQLIMLQAIQKSPYVTKVVQPANYGPLLYIVLRAWAKLPYKLGFVLFEISTFVALILPVLFWVPAKDIWMRMRDVTVISFFSYPVLVTLDRGNFEGLTFAFVVVGIWAYLRQNYWLFTALLIGAAWIKFYPIVFFVLLLSDRRWKEFVTGVAASAGGVFGGLLFFPGGYGANLRALAHQAGTFGPASDTFLRAVYYNRSVYGLFAVVHNWMTGSVKLQGFFVAHYAVLAGVATVVLVAASLQTRALRLWQRIFLLCVIITAIPEVSYGYTYVVLLIPIVLFLREEDSPGWYFWAYGLPLALVMLPKGIGIDVVAGTEITWLNLVDPGLLACLALIMAIECAWNLRQAIRRSPRGSHLFDRRSPRLSEEAS
jgi:hypothetical protein